MPNAKARHTFPLDAFPERLRRFTLALAEHTSTAPEMSAMMLLPAIAACVQDRYRILVRPGYREALAIQVLVGAETGVRKSPIENAIAEPFWQWQREQERLLEISLPLWQAQMRRAEQAVKAAEASKDDATGAELADALKRLADVEKRKPVARKVVVAGDLTLEGLISVMGENNGSLLVLDSEGSRYVSFLLGRWADGQTQLEVHLKGFTGEPYSMVRRKSENRLSVPRLQLSQAVMAQPTVLQRLYEERSLREMGFMGRQLVSHPESLVGARPAITPPIPREQQQYWSDLIRTLLRARVVEPTDQDVELTAAAPERVLSDIRMSPAAAAGPLVELFEAAESRHKKGHKWGPLIDWTSKITSHATRIAAVLHIAQHPDDFVEHEISEAAMRGACRLTMWSLLEFAHTVQVLGVDEDPTQDLGVLYDFFERRVRGQPNATQQLVVSARDVYRAHRRRWKRASEVEPALELLIGLGWLKALEPVEGASGRPSLRYVVNPRLFREDFAAS
ncbi:MAG TPA: DUF3987 domain-containing protein [Polyangiales bacterium]|nr:DUF3987 domain-containing protein [Polyangiales bacterium]